MLLIVFGVIRKNRNKRYGEVGFLLTAICKYPVIFLSLLLFRMSLIFEEIPLEECRYLGDLNEVFKKYTVALLHV